MTRGRAWSDYKVTKVVRRYYAGAVPEGAPHGNYDVLACGHVHFRWSGAPLRVPPVRRCYACCAAPNSETSVWDPKKQKTVSRAGTWVWAWDEEAGMPALVEVKRHAGED
jgi:hypothetical protein